MLLFAMTLGALARGRTLIDDCPITTISQDFAVWMQANHMECSHRDSTWKIEGAGLSGSFSPFQSLPQNHLARHLALCILSRDHETLFDFGGETAEANLQTSLTGQFKGKWEKGLWSFSAPDLRWKLAPSGEIPHFTRIRILLQALLHELPLALEEKATTRDQLCGMLAFFGAPILIETTGAEEMDELARRMARLQGQKFEKKFLTKLEPCKVLAGKEVFVPGDPTEACALAILASVIPGSEATIRNVCLNPGRAGAFNALKRMGANIEVVQKKERYGDQFGSIRVQSCKRLVGRKFSADIMMTCTEEVPLLSIAASLAEGESILRLPEHEAKERHRVLEIMTANLKKAGVEVGVYEEGIVVRGREELDSASFDAREEPGVALALTVLGRIAHGHTELDGSECLELEFPGLQSRLGIT
jgi:5-enolpyruvylshikimate-3-phosphate synthase